MANMEDARGRSKTKRLIEIPLRWRDRILGLIILFILLVVWEWQAQEGNVRELYFPAPSIILQTFLELVESGELFANIAATLRRLFIGFLLGGIPGYIIGILMGWSPRLRSLVDPIFAALHPIPKIAIFPLFMIFMGIGEESRIAVVAISAFFPLLINTMEGVLHISPIHFSVAQNYGASSRKILHRIILPGSLPMVLAGVRIAGNTALTLTIAIEVVASRDGLGAMIWFSWQIIKIAELYSTLVVITALGVTLNFLLGRIRPLLVPWYQKESG